MPDQTEPALVDRYRVAWRSARARATLLSDEVTRRAPLLGEYAAQIANLRTMYDVVSARENDLIEERDSLLEKRATDRVAVLSEAERAMLTYALDQAQEHIWARDGFTDEDQAAVDSLRRMAAGPETDGEPR